MTISTSHTTKVTCNRCSYEDTWIPETPEYIKWEWSRVTQGDDSMGSRLFRSNHKKLVFDLCPSCTREIKAWMRNGR